MLVICRKPHEGMMVGNAHIVVLEITNGKVRLGIEAPKEVVILRDELIQPEAQVPQEAK